MAAETTNASGRADGVIREKEKEVYTVSLKVPGGSMPVERLRAILDAAAEFGLDSLHLTIRQSVELLHVKAGDVEALVSMLAKAGQEGAPGGAKVRVPVACGGCAYNPFGLVDTQKAALEVGRTFAGMLTGHHKFKAAFSGCPNDCTKASTNDLGFVGAVLPGHDAGRCLGCGVCSISCPEAAINEDFRAVPILERESCVHCGACIRVCPSGAMTGVKSGYTVYVGGKWGKRPRLGTPVALFLPEEDVAGFFENVLTWYMDAARRQGRVRLGDLLTENGRPESLKSFLRLGYPEYVAT